MSDIQIIKAAGANQAISRELAQVHQEHQRKEQAPVNGLDLALLAILQSVQVGKDTAEIQVKGLKDNANAQELLINQMQQHQNQVLQNSQIETKVAIHKVVYITWGGGAFRRATVRTVGYKMEKKTVNATVLDQMQWKNELTNEVRGILQDKLNLESQSAQIKSGNLNSTTDCVQQTHQELTALLNNLVQLSGQTANM